MKIYLLVTGAANYKKESLSITVRKLIIVKTFSKEKEKIYIEYFYRDKNAPYARQAAEKYGLAIRKNGMACCPFHSDKHPSMKIDKNYHCFACGIGGDAIDYISRMFGLTQYQAAKKLIDDFSLMVEHGRKMVLSAKEKEKIIRARQENKRIIRIKKRFGRW